MDLINHYDISVLAFHNDWDINFIINVYSNKNQMALQVLCYNIRDIGNIVAMIGTATRAQTFTTTLFIWRIYLQLLIV